MSESSVQRVLAALKSATGCSPKRCGAGWSCRCPAHDDQRPSLAVAEGENGGVVIRCHAGCPTESVVAKLGLTMADLMPARTAAPPKPRKNGPKRGFGSGDAPRAFKSAEEAIAELGRQRGKCSAAWEYYDAKGEVVGVVVRWDRPDGKAFLPISRNGDGWVFEGMPAPRPLYQLPTLPGATRVYVCEGEKAADALRALGFTATTSPHGSKAAAKSDWTPLAGKDVVLFPDNDDAGTGYADDVIDLLAQVHPAPTVRRVELPDLPIAGDAVDYIAARHAAGATDDAIRAELEALLAAAEPVELVRPVPSTPRYEAFPLDALPDRLARYVSEMATALGCDPAYVVLPALAVVTASIGTSRVVELKSTWREYPIIWCAVIARSGSLKSPAFDAPLQPLNDAEREAMREHEEELKNYEREKLTYEAALTDWRRDGKRGEPPEKPEPPKRRRFAVADATIEAIATILADNPRGVLMARDELSAWLGGFNAYKAAGRGNDAATWLELWRAGTLSVDRKTGDRRTIYVPRAAASVCGTIQPGSFRRVVTAEHVENGLMARLLLVHPPEKQKKWSERVPSRGTCDGYANIVWELLALSHSEGKYGPEPVRLRLSPHARALWTAWYDGHAKRIVDAEQDRDAAALAKIEAYGARFSLIFELAANPQATEISADSMARAIRVANWFAAETERVYAILGATADESEQDSLLAWIERKGGRATVRDVTHGLRRFRGKPKEAHAALDALLKAGRGHWSRPAPGAAGGRPTDVFEIVTGDTGTKTPSDEAKNAVSDRPSNGIGDDLTVGAPLADGHAPETPQCDTDTKTTASDGESRGNGDTSSMGLADADERKDGESGEWGEL